MKKKYFPQDYKIDKRKKIGSIFKFMIMTQNFFLIRELVLKTNLIIVAYIYYMGGPIPQTNTVIIFMRKLKHRNIKYELGIQLLLSYYYYYIEPGHVSSLFMGILTIDVYIYVYIYAYTHAHTYIIYIG